MPSIPLHYETGNLHEMTAAELEYPAHRILEAFAASNTGVGTVTINGAGTAIGTFVDTIRPNTIGSHPVGTSVNSSTLTFNQDLTTAAESLERPIEYDGGNLHQQADGELNSNIIQTALTMLVNDGLGSYAVQPSAPAGTWTSIGTITDQARSGNTVTTLWRKTADTAPTTVRPMKVISGNLQEMTDAEIQTLTSRFRNRIVATGVGQYRVQQNAPAGGTWVRRGNAWTDTRQQIANQNYTGSYTGTYSGTYSRTFIGYSGLYYSGVLYASYTGFYTGYFTGFYTGTYTGTYTGMTVMPTKETVSTVSLWIRVA